MFRNIYYDSYKSTIHLWETIKGERSYSEINFVPYIFEKKENGYSNSNDIKSLNGVVVERKDFSKYRDYNDYCANNYDIYENKVKSDIQFLATRYYKIPDEGMEVPKLRIYSIDIEVHTDKGFPDPERAAYPIVLISVHDLKTGETWTFGEKEYTGNADHFEYVYCKTERNLMDRFLNFMRKYPPDVITGWNIIPDSKVNIGGGFDLPYIINRCKLLYGEDKISYHLLSPINKVRSWVKHGTNDQYVDIAGVTILDYLNLYKWYSQNKLPKYKLDYVSDFELGEQKHQVGDLRKLYYEDWNAYVEYNVQDTVLIRKLEEKLGYIRLVQTLSLLTRCPMKYYNGMTNLLEGLMLTHYRRNNLCAPTFFGGSQESYPAAYVKEPDPGQYDWLIDIDIASSYPTAIITLNMSTETYYGRIHGMSEDKILECMRKKTFPTFSLITNKGLIKIDGSTLKNFNVAIEKKLFAIAPCGSIFIQHPTRKGVIAQKEEEVFNKRKEIKAQRKKLLKSIPYIDDPEEKRKIEDKASYLFDYQWALKILINAFYGILAVPYSRYFNTNIAEAVTSVGRHTIKMGEVFVNDLLNDPDEKLQKIMEDL